MASLVLKNARIFDGHNEDCPGGMNVRIEDGLIREITSRPIQVSSDVLTIDVGGRTMLPGLIDAHVHAYFSDVNWQVTDKVGPAYRTAHAARMLGHALRCGFTTVRDIGGGDYGLWRAIEDGLITAPRFLYAGKMISMTGGHGDSRQIDESHHTQGYCTCGQSNSLAVIADGVEECIRAAREQLRQGAHCLKIMASGGVASPTDPIWMNQYREDEIRAIVNEAAERRTYVSAHCHAASSIRRCVSFGVRVIEHGTLIDDETARLVADSPSYVVPTMVVIFVLADEGERLGLPKASIEKVRLIAKEALGGLELMRKAGVKIGFGTDLLGRTYTAQCREFTIRSQVFSPLEILRQATSINAALLQVPNKLGCIRTDAVADLLVVDGDPLKDINVLSANGEHLRLVMRTGQIVRSDLRGS